MERNHPNYHYLVNQIPTLTEEQKARFDQLCKDRFQRTSDRLAQLVIEDIQAQDAPVPAEA